MYEEKEAPAAKKKLVKNSMALSFCIVPSLLLRERSWLGLNPTRFAVLMQIAHFRRGGERKPVPN